MGIDRHDFDPAPGRHWAGNNEFGLEAPLDYTAGAVTSVPRGHIRIHGCYVV